MIFSHARQVNFSRTVWITFHCRGTTSSVSVMSSPSLASLPPQHGQAVGPGITTRSRGRCAGKRRPHRLRAGEAAAPPSPSTGAGGGLVLGRARLQLLELQFQLVEQLAAALGGLARTARASAWRSAACRWATIASAPEARASACCRACALGGQRRLQRVDRRRDVGVTEPIVAPRERVLALDREASQISRSAQPARFRPPGVNRVSPVNPIKHVGQLRRGDRDRAVGRRRPDEPAALQPLGVQRHADARRARES